MKTTNKLVEAGILNKLWAQRLERKLAKHKKLRKAATQFVNSQGRRPVKIPLGKLEEITPSTIAGVAMVSYDAMVRREGLREFLLQPEVNALKLDGKRLELRFIVHRTGNWFNYRVAHHFAKISAGGHTVNYLVGGKIRGSKAALVRAIRQNFPEKKPAEAAAMAGEFINRASALAHLLVMTDDLMPDELAVTTAKVIPTKWAKKKGWSSIRTRRDITLSPILSDVDIVAKISGDDIEPALMEHHSLANLLSLKELYKEGDIPRNRWLEILRTFQNNISGAIERVKNEEKSKLRPAPTFIPH